MRCFVAVDLDRLLVPGVKALQERINNPGLKLVEENNLHFTLKFLGEIPESKAEMVKEKLSEIAAATPSFRISLAGLGVFPNEKYIRVIWIGVKSDKFINLHISVNNALSGLFREETPSPHLTIARIRSGKNNGQIADFLWRQKNIEIGEMVVNKIKLKESTLTKKGPLYSDVAIFELAP